MVEEIKTTLRYKSKRDNEQDINNEINDWFNLPVSLRHVVGIYVSYNIGWQKRTIHRQSSTYSSLSGHGFAIGLRTKKIVSKIVFGKTYQTCKIAKNSINPYRNMTVPATTMAVQSQWRQMQLFWCWDDAIRNSEHTTSISWAMMILQCGNCWNIINLVASFLKIYHHLDSLQIPATESSVWHHPFLLLLIFCWNIPHAVKYTLFELKKMSVIILNNTQMKKNIHEKR